MRHVRNVLVLTGALLVAVPLFSVTAPASQAATPSTIAATPQEQAAAIAQPSIVYLNIQLDYWIDTGQSGIGYIGPYTATGACSGAFVSSDGYIETAGHCVDVSSGSVLWDAAIQQALQSEVDVGTITTAEANALLPEALALWKVEGQAAGSQAQLTVDAYHGYGVSAKQKGEGQTARIVEAKSFEDGDVALIKVEEKNTPVLLLSSDSDVSIGTNVMAIGYPGAEDTVVDPDLTPTFKDGQINSKGTRNGVRVPVYEMSAALSAGMSGGPTVALDGRLVGINSFGIRQDSNFSFISPVSLVKEQLSRNDVKNELGVVDAAYQAGLTAYFAGDFKEAIAKFDEALGLEPSHLFAQQFKQKATEKQAALPPEEAAPASSSSSSSSVWIYVLIGAVLLILVLVVIVLLVVKGRGKPGTTVPPTAAAAGYGATAPQGPPPGAFPPPGPPTATMPAAPGGAVATAAPAGADATATRFCSSCGAHLETDARFCPSCGHDAQAQS